MGSERRELNDGAKRSLINLAVERVAESIEAGEAESWLASATAVGVAAVPMATVVAGALIVTTVATPQRIDSCRTD